MCSGLFLGPFWDDDWCRKIDRRRARAHCHHVVFVDIELAGCAILGVLGVLGVGLAAGLLSGASKDLSKLERFEFSIEPGETHRIGSWLTWLRAGG